MSLSLVSRSFLALALADAIASVVSTTDPVLWLVRLPEFGTPSTQANFVLAYKFIRGFCEHIA